MKIISVALFLVLVVGCSKKEIAEDQHMMNDELQQIEAAKEATDQLEQAQKVQEDIAKKALEE